MVYSRVKKLGSDIKEVFADKPKKTDEGWIIDTYKGIIYRLNSSYQGSSEISSTDQGTVYQSGFSKRMGEGDTVTIEYNPTDKGYLVDYMNTRPASALVYAMVAGYLANTIGSLVTGRPPEDPANMLVTLFGMSVALNIGANRNYPKIESARIKKATGKLEEVYERLKKASDNEK